MAGKFAFIIITVIFITAAGFISAEVQTRSMNDAAIKGVRIEIRKKARTLKVFDGDKLLKTYKMVLGFSPLGDKEVEGDGKTPEGSFYVFTKNPESKFYLSLGISYPAIDDAERGLKANLISGFEFHSIKNAIDEKAMPPQKTKLGGEI